MNDDGLNVPLIRLAWSRETSSSPAEWHPQNRARGQCAVTACVVQDVFDGTLIRSVATLPDGTTESHYATVVEHGVIIDLTDEQFPEGTEFGPWEERTRAYVLGFPETKVRYVALCRRLNELRTLERLTEWGTPI